MEQINRYDQDCREKGNSLFGGVAGREITKQVGPAETSAIGVDEDIIHSWDILGMLFTVLEFVYWDKGMCDVEWEVWDFVLGLLIEMRSSRIRYRLGKRLKKLVFLCWL